MGKWTIICNGSFFGEYPNEKVAMSAWNNAIQPRPKSSYNMSLIDPSGEVRKSITTPTGRSGR